MTHPEDDEEAVYEAAARWWQHQGGEEPYDAEAFKAWLDADERHAAAYRQVGATWDAMDTLGTAPEVLALRSEVLNRARRTGGQRWSGQSGSGMRLDRRTLLAGAGLAAAAAGGVFGVRALLDQPRQVTTRTGEQRAMTLADNSRVTVDARSALKIDYAHDARVINLLSGRVYFEVAKDASRPFRVVAGARTVTAIGTAFTVEMRDGKVTVTLFEGRIAVSDNRSASKPAIDDVRPLEQLVLSDAEDAIVRSFVDAGRALGWRDGKLFFEDEPLSSAAARMNDYSNDKIFVAGSVGGLRINGMFLAGRTDAFVEALQSYYAVRAERGTGGVTIRARS